MSGYINNNTNVHKPPKHKYVNIDTKFRDDYYQQTSSNCNITLPERINDVKTISITNVEIPITFYNISSSFDNNYFNIHVNATDIVITIPDGNYDNNTLIDAINTECLTHELTFTILLNNKIKVISNNPTTIKLTFDINNYDNYTSSSKLGWMLGFRKNEYNIELNATQICETILDLSGPVYLYLAIDEFNKNNQNTFVSPLSMTTSTINKNILARISLDMKNYPFGTTMPVNRQNGMLISDTRIYSGKIDLCKLNIQVLDKYGKYIDFNGMDISFCIEIKNE